VSWLGADPAQECEALIKRLRSARADAQIALADAEHRAEQKSDAVDEAVDEELDARAAADTFRTEVRDLTSEIDEVLEELHALIPKQHRPAAE